MFKSIVDRFTRLWRRVPRAIRSGWVTAWVTFVGSLLTIVTNLFPAILDLITTRSPAAFYEQLSVSVTLAISAVSGLLFGVVNAIYRWIRPIADAYQIEPPQPE